MFDTWFCQIKAYMSLDKSVFFKRLVIYNKISYYIFGVGLGILF